MFYELQTGPSVWAPLAMLAGFAVLLVIVAIIRALGNKGFKAGKNSAMPFYSGNIVTESERVKSSDFFWGFFEAFEGYYDKMRGMHTGIVNDYVAWFIAVTAVILVVLAAGAVQWA